MIVKSKVPPSLSILPDLSAPLAPQIKYNALLTELPCEKVFAVSKTVWFGFKEMVVH
nr:MAG TPA: hypothetical protein [Caudoviricetes sp.]